MIFIRTLLIVFLLSPLNVYPQSKLTYKIVLDFIDTDLSKETVQANVNYNITLTSSTDDVIIPLPFRIDGNNNFFIEPTSDNNLVLIGSVRPTENFSVCQIKMDTTSSHISLHFENIEFSIKNASHPSAQKAVYILLGEAYRELRRLIPNGNFALVSELEILCKDFVDSNPRAEVNQNNFSRIIKCDIKDGHLGNLILFINLKPNQYFLYGVLGIMGLLLGYFTAPRVIKKRSGAILTLVLNTILLLVILYITLVVLSTEQLISDTTVIVTIGMVSGLMLGSILIAIQFLANAKDRTDEKLFSHNNRIKRT